MVFCIIKKTNAQELFVVTEPASNIPAKSLNLRLANYFMQIDTSKKTSYHAMPEIAFGINNNLMLRVSIVSSNRLLKLNAEGINLYAKYRFFSKDDVHKHFRMAAFARWSTNNSPIHMQEMNLLMHNSGYEVGTVATGLLHKTAISTSVSYQRAISTAKVKNPFIDLQNSANYSLSFGQLLLPKKYTSYKQTNVNVMLEFLGQVNPGNNKGYLDIVPSIQAIFNSVARLDIGYRTQIAGTIQRDFSKGFILKLEYNIFNALK